MSEEKAKYCVTLVHGTFAPNANWTQEGSVLRKTFEKALGGKRQAQFVPVGWSGANSQTERLSGSAKLSEKLLQNFHQYPDAAHFVVAHSHGGNIALMSCAAPSVAKTVSGLICLATPFLSYAPRRYLLNLWLFVLGGFAWLSFGLLLALSGFPSEPLTSGSATIAQRSLTVRQAFSQAASNGVVVSQSPQFFADAFIKPYQGIKDFLDFGPMLFLALICPALIWISLKQVRKFAKKNQVPSKGGRHAIPNAKRSYLPNAQRVCRA
jgi:hypothetical protein